LDRDIEQLIKLDEEQEKRRTLIFRRLLKKIRSLDRDNKRLIDLESKLRDLLSAVNVEQVREKLELLSKLPNEEHAGDYLLDQIKPKVLETLAEVLKSDEVLEDLRLEFLKTLANFPPEKKDKLESLLLAFQIGALLPDIDEIENDEEKIDNKCEMSHRLAEALGDIKVVDIKNQGKRITELEITILHDKGIVLLEARKYEKAYKCFEDIIKINPELKKAWLNRGIAARGMMNYEEERKCYDRALEKDPDYALAHYDKGILLKEIGMDVEAEQSFKKAYEINPKLRRQYGGF
jgi:tetratricopeptide (TPR) repeat protein